MMILLAKRLMYIEKNDLVLIFPYHLALAGAKPFLHKTN